MECEEKVDEQAQKHGSQKIWFHGKSWEFESQETHKPLSYVHATMYGQAAATGAILGLPARSRASRHRPRPVTLLKLVACGTLSHSLSCSFTGLAERLAVGNTAC